MKTALRNNPVKAQGGVTGVIASFITSLGNWGMTALELPQDVVTSANGVLLIVAAVIGSMIGKWVQRRYTEPKGVIDEIIANQHGEEANVPRYSKARAHDETDHLPPNMEGK